MILIEYSSTLGLHPDMQISGLARHANTEKQAWMAAPLSLNCHVHVWQGHSSYSSHDKHSIFVHKHRTSLRNQFLFHISELMHPWTAWVRDHSCLTEVGITINHWLALPSTILLTTLLCLSGSDAIIVSLLSFSSRCLAC